MRLKSIASAFGIAMAAVLGLNAVSYAATGHAFVLGHGNAANSLTSVTRTTNGPALGAFSRPGQPPLAVNRNVRVPNLNADMVDGLQGSALATRQRPLRISIADPAPGRFVAVSGSATTVQSVSWNTPAECGANTRHVYLAEQSGYADGSTTVRASIDVDSTGIQFGPGFTLTSSTPYGPLTSSRKLVLAPGAHTVRTVGDTTSGTSSIGDPSLVVTDLGYTCSGGPVSARHMAARVHTATGR